MLDKNQEQDSNFLIQLTTILQIKKNDLKKAEFSKRKPVFKLIRVHTPNPRTYVIILETKDMFSEVFRTYVVSS